MNIGIDIDDTINRLSDTITVYAKKYNEENKLEYPIKEEEWDFEKAFGWDENHIEGFLNKYMEKCFREVRIKPEAKDYINRLKEEGNKIIIITARTKDHCKDVYNISKNWFIEQGVKIDKLEINCLKKAEKCKEHKIDIFVDDNIENCKEVNEALNIPVLMFDSIYNKKEKDLKRVYSWKEAYEEIKVYEIYSENKDKKIIMAN